MSEPAAHLPFLVPAYIGDQWDYWVEIQVKSHLLGMEYDNAAMQRDMNNRGAIGWELVMCMGGQVSKTQHQMQFIWKRKITATMQ